MGIKDIAKKGYAYIGFLTSVASALFSSTAPAETIERKVASGLRPMRTQEEIIDPKLYIGTIATPESAFARSIDTAENFSKNKLWNIPQKYADWYLADFLMVLVHETGHYQEAQRQRLNPSLYIEPTPFWVNGGVGKETDARDGEDSARLSIAGFVNAGNLAELLKQDIVLWNIPEKNLRFMSMLALASELNLPFYLMQHYAGTASDNGNDIQNFSQNTGIRPETMAISSGIHMLVNAPYMYRLAKNVLGPSPTAPEKKDYFVSFRYNGDSYIITFHSDLNTIVEKMPKPRFMLMHVGN